VGRLIAPEGLQDSAQAFKPELCAQFCRRQLIEKDNVLAIIGNVGTSTATVVVPLANEQMV
jgi:hypothetical protein